MIYPVCLYGSPVLRKVAEKIDKDYEGLNQLIEDMFETMYTADGVGLAAPQIGKSIRLIVIDASPLEEDDPELKDFKKVIINPVITEKSCDIFTYNEGCLSIPGIREDIIRPRCIQIQYYDENFNFHDERHEGIKARILQHEYNHLEGVLFVDLVAPIRKKILKGKLKAISKGKIDTEYKVKLP